MNMHSRFLPLFILPAFLLLCADNAFSQTSASQEQAAIQIKDLNTPRDFPKITSRAQWEQRAREIREQILVSAGLWPMPEKTPLQAKVFGKIIRDGYSIEKVSLQPWPGFYLAGNLYRPIGKGNGPFPGVLNPHGHWPNGRMADNKDGSIAARCISFARQGMIAFSYDMVGYNDTRFADSPAAAGDFYKVHRRFATNDNANLLWGITLMGLQTWDSIRALDFLESLPDVDKKRLACTGESGGGTQTFMLGAIDDRLAAQAPVVMVSHTMQGGCGCENMPGLRVEYSNMEIAAAAAPRPQIMVAATGDWTKDMPRVEGPAVESVYRLFGAPEKLRYVQFDFGHNYNQTSREAVYEWFGGALLDHVDPSSLKEAPYTKEPDADLRVFPDGQLPADALTEEQLITSLKKRAQDQLIALLPRDKASFENFQQVMLPAWRHTLQVDWPQQSGRFSVNSKTLDNNYTVSELEISRPGGRKIEAVLFPPSGSPARNTSRPNLVILVHPDGGPAFFDASEKPMGLAKKLSEDGNSVLVIKKFSTDEPVDQFANFFSAYNRTLLQERVADLLAVCSQATVGFGTGGNFRTVLCGGGWAGLWALLVAPGADAVIADCDGLDANNDQALLAPDLFCPGIRRIGDFEGAAILAAPRPLLLHNLGRNFPDGSVRAAYAALKSGKDFRAESKRLDDEALAGWISQAR